MSDFPKILVKGDQKRTANTQADVVRFEFDGFTLRDKQPATKTPAATTSTSGTAATFDPAEHTVAEVEDYLDTADEAERDRVLAAEREGKGRSTLLA